jgi:hypothetical protein
MRVANVVLVCLLAAGSIALTTSQAKAQVSEERAAAIHRCIAAAHSQYSASEENQQRTDVYKACMTAAGQTP